MLTFENSEQRVVAATEAASKETQIYSYMNEP